MTPVFEMRSFICVALMSVQFVVTCMAIHNATVSFLYKIKLWRSGFGCCYCGDFIGNVFGKHSDSE